MFYKLYTDFSFEVYRIEDEFMQNVSGFVVVAYFHFL